MIPSIEFSDELINGTKVISRRVFFDKRGEFDRLFSKQSFSGDLHGFNVKDVNVSTSKKSVLRGMHFQKAPFGQRKLITVLDGEILDLTFKVPNASDPSQDASICSIVLSARQKKSLLVPANVAHGFLVLSETATIAYLMDEVFNPAAYHGINWRSFGYDWPIKNPIVSEQDNARPSYADYLRSEETLRLNSLMG
jgi:dTDP-4-dehydrorhamnose 3,5-epimerase